MSSSGAPRVLVADRDAAIRSLLMAVVQHMNLEPVVARDAEAAVALAAANELEAAIVDLREDGAETLERLVAARPSLRGRIIVITTLPPGALEKCAATACILRKPFQLDELQQSLRAAAAGERDLH